MEKTKKQMAEEALVDAERDFRETEEALEQRGRELLGVQEEIKHFPIDTGDAGELAQLKAKEQTLDGIFDTLVKVVEQKKKKVKSCEDDLAGIEHQIDSTKRLIAITERKLGPSGDTAARRRAAQLELEVCKRVDESNERELQRLNDWLIELDG